MGRVTANVGFPGFYVERRVLHGPGTVGQLQPSDCRLRTMLEQPACPDHEISSVAPLLEGCEREPHFCLLPSASRPCPDHAHRLSRLPRRPTRKPAGSTSCGTARRAGRGGGRARYQQPHRHLTTLPPPRSAMQDAREPVEGILRLSKMRGRHSPSTSGRQRAPPSSCSWS